VGESPMPEAQTQPPICPQCQTPIADPAAARCPGCRLPLRLLAGKYRFLRALGQGGFGTIYLARHTGLHRQAERVIKVLKPERVALPAVRERFLQEIQLTAALWQENPHVVRLFDDFGEEEGLGYFYVMEYLKGRSLKEVLKREGPLERSRAVEL